MSLSDSKSCAPNCNTTKSVSSHPHMKITYHLSSLKKSHENEAGKNQNRSSGEVATCVGGDAREPREGGRTSAQQD